MRQITITIHLEEEPSQSMGMWVNTSDRGLVWTDMPVTHKDVVQAREKLKEELCMNIQHHMAYLKEHPSGAIRVLNYEIESKLSL